MDGDFYPKIGGTGQQPFMDPEVLETSLNHINEVLRMGGAMVRASGALEEDPVERARTGKVFEDVIQKYDVVARVARLSLRVASGEAGALQELLDPTRDLPDSARWFLWELWGSKYSQEQIADKLGVSRSMVSRVRTGHTVLRPPVARKMAELFADGHKELDAEARADFIEAGVAVLSEPPDKDKDKRDRGRRRMITRGEGF